MDVVCVQLHQRGPGLVHEERVGAGLPQGLLAAPPGLQHRDQQEMFLRAHIVTKTDGNKHCHQE